MLADLQEALRQLQKAPGVTTGASLAAQFPGGWTYQLETIREDRGGVTNEPAAFPGGFVFVPVICSDRPARLAVPMGMVALQRSSEAAADSLAVQAMAAAGRSRSAGSDASGAHVVEEMKGQ